MMKSFECTVQLYETCMYLLNICWSTVCSLFNYFYTKTRCQETLFSFILKTLPSSLFASMFCQSILLMSASPLLLFSTAGMMHDPDYIPYKKRAGNTQKNISLWPSLLCTLDTIVLFEYFTLDRVFKISRRRMLQPFLFFLFHIAFGNLSRPMWCIIRI